METTNSIKKTTGFQNALAQASLKNWGTVCTLFDKNLKFTGTLLIRTKVHTLRSTHIQFTTHFNRY